MENVSENLYPIYKFTGIIFTIKNIGDYDSIFSIYTKEGGLINVFFKSMRKESSKMRMIIEEGALVTIETISSKKGFLLTGAEEIEKFSTGSLSRHSSFSKVIDLLNTFIVGTEKNESFFEVIVESRKYLMNEDIVYSDRDLERAIFIKLLSSLGYNPDIDLISIDLGLGEILELIKTNPSLGKKMDLEIDNTIKNSSF